MRILYITNHLRGDDGWSRYSVEILNEVKKLGHQIRILTLGDSLKYLANPWQSFKGAQKIKKIVKQFSPEVIHFMVEPYATTLAFLNLKNCQVILTIHGTYAVIPVLFNSFLQKRIAQELSNKYYIKVDKIVAVSNFTKNYLLKYYPALLEKVTVITNGINLEKLSIDKFYKRKNFSKKQILFVGVVRPRKGILQSIEALNYYQKNYSENFVYNIVGRYAEKSDYYKKIKQKIKKYHLEDKIFFRGRVSQLQLNKFYQQADLLLMLSLKQGRQFEGFGLTYLEANARGVPCIGGTTGGVQEAILEGQTGYLAEVDNVAEVAQKIDLILNKKKISAQQCLQWAQANDIKQKVKKLINLYAITN